MTSELVPTTTVPLRPLNRNPKSVLRLCQTGCSVQDSSWKRQPMCLLCKDKRDFSRVKHVIDDFPESVDDDFFVREGMFHAKGQHPSGALCPVLYIGSKSVLHQGCDVAEDTYFRIVYFFVDASAHSVVISELQHLFSNKDYFPIGSSLSYLQLRGVDAKDSLLGASRTVEKAVPGVVLPFLDSEPAHLSGLVFEAFDGSKAILLRQQPRRLLQASNVGVNGFDIVCHPSVLRVLFLYLVSRTNSFAVGHAEELLMMLEAHPPVPTFPRDFPGTPEGRLFWGDQSRRRFLDTVGRAVSSPIDFVSSLALKRSEGDKREVMVLNDKGSLLLLQELFRVIASCNAEHGKQCQDCVPVVAAKCTTLVSLPGAHVLAQCQISISSSGGRVRQGDVFSSITSPGVGLGIVTDAFFSRSRGSFQGIGLIDIATLLRLSLCAESRPQIRDLQVSINFEHSVCGVSSLIL